MKISVIITTMLAAQVSASFYDVFHGAVLSVQNSFGKLLSDVVTDVKETVDCTILAVEHVLALSPDATAQYYNKCGTNKTDSVNEARQDATLPKVEVTFNLPNNEEFLEKVIPAEIDEKINETLSKILDNHKSHDNVLSIEKVLAKESKQLAGVSGLVKKELEKLSNEVTSDLKNIDKQRDSQPSVDSILQEIKVLEKRELITKNATEANEIHQVIEQVLKKLDAIEATDATENVKLEEILKELENNSNKSFVGIRHQFEQWTEEESRHLNQIKSNIDEHEKISDLRHGSYGGRGSNETRSILLIKDVKRDDFYPISETSSNNTTMIKNILDNSTSSRKFEGKSFILVANKVSSFQNKTFEYSGMNDAVKTTNLYFNTERSIGNEIIYIHPLEIPTSIGSSELSGYVNQSTTPENNGNGDISKKAENKTALSITARTPLNKNNQSIDTTTELEKQKLLATQEPAVPIFSTNENNSIETMIMSNPKQGLETEDVKLNNSKIDTMKVLSSDSAKNNVTFIGSLAEIERIPASLNDYNLNETVISTTGNIVVKNISLSAKNPDNVVFSTFSTNELSFDDIKSNDEIISTSIHHNSTLVNYTIGPIETTSTTGNVESSTVTMRESDDSYDSKITSTTIATIKNAPVSENIQPKESTTASSKQESTAKIVHYNNSNEVVITSTSLQTVENLSIRENIQIEETSNTLSNNTTIPSYSSPVVDNITPKETITAFDNEESLNISNESTITITPLSVEVNTPVRDTFEVIELINTPNIENYSSIAITSPIPIVSTAATESETIQDIITTTIYPSQEESTTETLKTADGDDDSGISIQTRTSDTIAKSKLDENVAATENIRTLASDNFINTDSDSVTSAPFPLTEITTISAIIDLVESTTPTENKEPTILTTKCATILDEIKNENTDSKYTLVSTTKNTEGIQKVRITSVSEEQDFSSTSTQAAINEMATTRIAFTPTDRIPKTENDLENSPRSVANSFVRNIPDLNYSPRIPPLTVIESPSVIRKRITSNELNQRDNTNGETGSNYASKSLSGRSLHTRQPLNIPEVPVKMLTYGQPVVSPILRSLFKDKLQDADENSSVSSFDVMEDQLLLPASPVGNNIAIANIPLISGLTNPPRKPLRRLENPSFVAPLYTIRPPFSFVDKASRSTFRPTGLTTHIPRTPEPRTNNHKSPSMDYDSFFLMPPRNSEAHQRAFKEALQLMANSKRSDRIINNIMKKKNKFNARSIFNG